LFADFAPKLYHIILAGVKHFRITYFLCVIKKQRIFWYNIGLAGKKEKRRITPQKIGY
jgi:hypothetical protein